LDGRIRALLGVASRMMISLLRRVRLRLLLALWVLMRVHWQREQW
jgi:hypothetical protein